MVCHGEAGTIIMLFDMRAAGALRSSHAQIKWRHRHGLHGDSLMESQRRSIKRTGRA